MANNQTCVASRRVSVQKQGIPGDYYGSCRYFYHLLLLVVLSISAIGLVSLHNVQAKGVLDNEREDLEHRMDKLDEEAIQLIRTGRHIDAVKLLQEEASIAERLYSKDKYPNGHATLAAILSKLGTVYGSTRDYAKARSFLEQALAMHRDLYPPNKYPDGHPNLVNSLSNLALLLSDQGRYREAEPLFREALQISVKALGEEDSETAACPCPRRSARRWECWYWGRCWASRRR